MRASVPAALLAGPQPHRGGVLEGEGDLEEGPSPNPRNAHRNHGPGAGGGGPFGRPRLLRTPWVPRCYGSTVLTNALGETATVASSYYRGHPTMKGKPTPVRLDS